MKNSIIGKIAVAFSLLICICAYGQETDGVYYGDVNYDNAINASDALLVLKDAAVIEELNDAQKLRADVNGDNNIDSRDALLILKYAASIIDEFPVIPVTENPTPEVTEVQTLIPTQTARLKPTETP